MCRHLGHTTKVHLTHYRTMSSYLERVNVGKILLMQDLNIQAQFSGKKLDEINFMDMLETEQDRRAVDSTNQEDDIGEEVYEEERMEVEFENAKTGKTGKRKRQHWTVEEMNEIECYLGIFLNSLKTPSMKDCVKAKRESLKNGGQLHKRHWHLIVKKVSAMIQKKKK